MNENHGQSVYHLSVSKESRDELLMESLPQIRAIAMSMVRSHPAARNMVLSEDLEQEGALAALLSARRYEPGKGNFGAFIKQNVAGRMMEQYRRKNLEHQRLMRDRIDPDMDVPDYRAQCDDEGQEDREQQSQQLVDQALQSLPEREAAILRMFFLEKMTQKEIGVRLGLGNSRISQLQKEALRKARACFEGSHIPDVLLRIAAAGNVVEA